MPQDDPDAPPPPAAVNRKLITACVMLATIMQTIDSTIANVALPYMQGSLAASQDEINWVLTSYIIAAAIMTTPTGFLAARFGRTRLFVFGVIGFTVTSVLCGMSQTLSEMVVCRIMQGMFGAGLVPLSQAILLDIYPAEKRGFAMSIWTMGALIGPVVGPTLGGWLTENYNWRSVFYINVPFGVLTAVGLMTFLKETSHSRAIKLDWIGFGALSLAVGAFQAMLDRGETLDWFNSREIVVEACLAGLGFYIFLVQSALAPKPFLSPKLLADVNFVIAGVFIFMIGLVIFATLALLAPYLQVMMNYPVATAGLVLAPRGAGSIIAALVAGRLVQRTGARVLIGIGFTVCAIAQYQMTLWTPAISDWTICCVGFVQGLGVSCISVPLATIAFSTLPLELRTEATGIFSLVRNLGSAIGISVTGALLQNNTQVNHAVIAGGVTPFNRTFQSGAALKLLNPVSTQGSALLDSEITRQAYIIAYLDDFKLMLVLTLMALPLVLLIRPAKREVAEDIPDGVTE